jgi:hypothetical protein
VQADEGADEEAQALGVGRRLLEVGGVGHTAFDEDTLELFEIGGGERLARAQAVDGDLVFVPGEVCSQLVAEALH